MHEIANGFRIDGRLIAWGTTLASAATEAGAGFEDDGRPGYRHIRIRCKRAYGFDALAVTIAGFGGDRPVTSLAYELALPGDGDMDAENWLGPIRHAFGAPADESTEDIADDGTAASRVRHYARWASGDVSLGLSIFGAPRNTPEGRSAGILWLDWSHVKAAIPYLPSWRAGCAALAVAARGELDVRIFGLQVAQNAAHGARGRDAALKRASDLALMSPDVLDTPLEIASRLTPKQIGIWRNPALKLACFSTRFDSVMWDEGAPLEVTYQVTKPAKGGGRLGLQIGRLSVYEHFGSPALEDAANALAAIPGVTINRQEDYDC